MQPILMEDWVTVRGNGVTVIQSAGRWIRTAVFQDIYFSIDVREVTGSISFSVETSPSRDEALFQAMFTAFTPAVGMNFKAVRAAEVTTSVPVSEWSRWKVVLPVGATNDVTFRVLAHGNRLC